MLDLELIFVAFFCKVLIIVWMMNLFALQLQQPQPRQQRRQQQQERQQEEQQQQLYPQQLLVKLL